MLDSNWKFQVCFGKLSFRPGVFQYIRGVSRSLFERFPTRANNRWNKVRLFNT